jgi:hypothetical protein
MCVAAYEYDLVLQLTPQSVVIHGGIPQRRSRDIPLVVELFQHDHQLTLPHPCRRLTEFTV